jgi:hypothetical protein
LNFWVALSFGAGAVAFLIIGWMVYDFIKIQREYAEEVIESEAFGGSEE